MKEIIFRECCKRDKQYIAHFEKESIPVLCCEKHFADKTLLNGAKKIYNLKTKKEVHYE